MRLAFVIFRYFPHGGLQRKFLEIAQRCLQQRHVVHVFTMEWSGLCPSEFQLTVIKTFSLSNHGRAKQFVNKVLPVLNNENFDVVVGFNKMPGLDIYYAGDPCYVERISKKYLSWQSRLLRWTPRYRTLQGLEEEVFAPGGASRVLLLSEGEERYYRLHYGTPSERFHVLPPGILQDRRFQGQETNVRQTGRNLLNVGIDQICVLLVGAAFRTKGLDRAIRAVAALPSGLKQRVKLVAVGDRRSQPFLRLARRLGIQNNIVCLPPQASIPELMAGADLLIHPSICDSGAVVLLEAMAMGLPILTTDVCGYSKNVVEAQAGRVVSSPFHQTHLDRTLLEMLSSLDEKTWSTNGIKYAQRHGFQEHTSQVVRLIETS